MNPATLPARRLTLLRFIFLPLALCLLAGIAAAEDRAPPPFKEWQKTLDDLDRQLENPELTDGQLVALRDRLVQLRGRLQGALAAAAAEMEVVRRDQDALGPAPKEGEPPEVPAVVDRRKSLNAQLAAADGTTKTGGLMLAQIDRAADRVEAARRNWFTSQIFTRRISPLTPALWARAWIELKGAWNTVLAAVAGGIETEMSAGTRWTLGRHAAVGLAIGLVLAFPLRSSLIRRFGYIAVEGAPDYRQRLWAAVFTGVVDALLPTMAAAAVYLGLVYDGALAEPASEVARTLLAGLTGVLFVSGFCRSALAPNAPEWRLVPVHDVAARAVSRGVTALAALFAVDWVLREILSLSDSPVELIAVHKFLLGLAISAVLLYLLRRRVWFPDAGTRLGPGWRRLRTLLSVLVWAIPLSAMLGYVVLSRLLATQLVLTAGLWALVALLRVVLAELVAQSLSRDGVAGQYLRGSLGASDDGAEIVRFWLNGVLQFGLMVLGILSLPWIWGFNRKDFDAWFQGTFFGFTVGNLRISLEDLVLALILFAVFLSLTRLLQRILDDRIFPRTRMDLGMRHSIRSGVGYIGFAVASLVAVSTLGIDLSNLAIIAGALSVGIGFGLQNIVNNFVSGLILLVERPIKAGDWVVVGAFQGHVKKISVRATEITTFDRASVFIPNSELIAGTVMNRTYADNTGRVQIPIGLSYDGDPAKAREVLLAVASAHPGVRDHPPPLVNFKGFGDSALNLELIAYLEDVENTASVTTDLCFGIHRAFREQGLSMPFPQRDVRVSLDPAQWPGARERDEGAPAPEARP